VISRVLTLFRPAVALVGRLRYVQKFVVVGLVLLVPLAVVTAAYVNLQRAQIAFSAKERQGVAYLAPLVSLTGGLVDARHAAVTRPDTPVPALAAQIARVDSIDTRLGDVLDAHAGWRDARRLTLVALRSDGTTDDRYRQFNTAAAALLALVIHVGDESNLTLDPDLDTYYLMDMLQFRLPVLLNTAGHAVDQAVLANRAGGLATRATDVFVELGLDNGVITNTRAAVGYAVQTIAGHTRNAGVRAQILAGFGRLDRSSAALSDLLRSAGQQDRADSVPAGAADRLRVIVEQFAADAETGLDVLLHARIDDFSTRAARVEVVTGLGGLLAVYLFVGFYLSVAPPIGRIVATLHAVADGDLSRRVVVDTHDELSFVARTLNDTISQTEVARNRLAEQATHDTLTGLPNRALALDRLRKALARAQATGGVVAVLFVDLDRFKIINDSLGHEAGDEVLRTVAHRLTGVARSTDTVCRLAGDEFVVISEDLAHPEDAMRIGERAVAELSRVMMTQRGREVGVGASIGVAYTLPGSVTAPEEMLRDADMAMYRAKQRGRGRVEVFDDALRIALEHHVAVEDDLRHGIEAGQLRVHYQPIVATDTGDVVGFEALVRWQHPVRGLLGPVEFIGVAEESGLIVPLGARVLTDACRQVASWRAHRPGCERLYVSVNVSATQFSRPSFVPTVAQVLAATGLDPDALWLEITETSIMADEEVARTTLDAVRGLGVRLAIDDFGTGYSPLTYLRRFPVDALKIDRSFVAALGLDREDEAIATMILTLAQALDLSTVAEGVETDAQREWLSRRGCTALQGYHFGRPVPAGDVWDRSGAVQSTAA
jgi:diguanylate cyclase (GGDEF)-like protein